MGKISKGSSSSIGIAGVLCLVWGAGLSIISWIIASKAPTSISVHDGTIDTEAIRLYWWSGISFVLPGMLGIVVAFTRSSVLMAFFLIFDILCLLASIGMSVVVGLVVVFWQAINEQLQNDIAGCATSLFSKQCVCVDISQGKEIKMGGTTCEDLVSIQSLLIALIVFWGLSVLLLSVASYISCGSFCNTEQEYEDSSRPPVVVNVRYPEPQVGAMQYQSPPPYLQQSQQYVQSHDKANLVQNIAI